jgi:hypothetical protein
VLTVRKAADRLRAVGKLGSKRDERGEPPSEIQPAIGSKNPGLVIKELKVAAMTGAEIG